MTTGFGTARMQHAINHWEHFDTNLFERVMDYKEGRSVYSFRKRRNPLFPIVFYVIMFLLQFKKK
jgi:hypothetical protein